MLFRKKMQKACVYCVHGTQISEDQVLCTKRGAVLLDGKCRKFQYDPCKRIPPKPKALDFSKYNEENFSI